MEAQVSESPKPKRPDARTMSASKRFLSEHPNGFTDLELATFVQEMRDEAADLREAVVKKARMA